LPEAESGAGVGAAGDAGAITKSSPRSVADTVARLLELLDEKGLTVFAVIDQRAAAQTVGLEMPETTLVVFGNPKAGTPVMVAAPLSALDLPLKLLIWADHDGATRVSYVDPAVIATRYDLKPEQAAAFAPINTLSDALVAS
jgi:uncharacterized protein (DUF302 family)